MIPVQVAMLLSMACATNGFVTSYPMTVASTARLASTKPGGSRHRHFNFDSLNVSQSWGEKEDEENSEKSLFDCESSLGIRRGLREIGADNPNLLVNASNTLGNALGKSLENAGDTLGKTLGNSLENAGDTLGKTLGNSLENAGDRLGKHLEKGFLYLGLCIVVAAVLVNRFTEIMEGLTRVARLSPFGLPSGAWAFMLIAGLPTWRGIRKKPFNWWISKLIGVFKTKKNSHNGNSNSKK